MHVSWLDQQPDRRAFLPVDLDVGERRNQSEFDSGWRQKSTRDRNSFDGLVEGSRADCLYLG